MARAETVTKLPLDRWAYIMGIHPLHFNQVRLENNPHCDQLMFQHEWQNSDHVSREEIARAIAEAETKIEDYLGYRLMPTWEVDEWNGTHRSYQPENVIYGALDVRGFRQTVRANWGYMISGGVKSKELVEQDAPIVWTDENNDGYFETATVTVITVALDKNEIAVYYPGEDGDDSWEIRPTEVSISGGIATIRFKRELTVRPEFFDLFDITEAGLDGTDDDNFLSTVDVYRRYNDPQSQVSFLWEPFAGYFCGTCGGSGCPSCAYETQTGCLILRGDPRTSIVGYWPGEWDVDEDVFITRPWAVGRNPDIVRLYYYAGWRNRNQKYISRMAPEWELPVAYMAAAMLDRPPCDCVSNNWNQWRFDLTLADGDQDGHPIFREPGSGLVGGSKGPTDNPFGTRRGELYAWRKVRDLAIFSSVDLRG